MIPLLMVVLQKYGMQCFNTINVFNDFNITNFYDNQTQRISKDLLQSYFNKKVDEFLLNELNTKMDQIKNSLCGLSPYHIKYFEKLDRVEKLIKFFRSEKDFKNRHSVVITKVSSRDEMELHSLKESYNYLELF
jgi:hypothetical protein